MAVLALDLGLTASGVERSRWPGVVALAGAAAAIASALSLMHVPTRAWLFGRMLVFDGFSVYFKVLLGLALLAAVWMSLGSHEVRGQPNEGEYFTLLLSSALAMFLMAAAGNLLMAYLSLEFASLTSYVLTGFLRHNRRSGEAALKYLIYGGVASGAMIYGMSWVFGLTGSMDYAGIARGVATLDAASRPALFLGLVLVLAGFGYKIASVPFHMWAPDVYTGAPIPVTAFLAVGSKAAGFAMLLRFFHFGVGAAGPAAVVTRVPLLQLGTLLCAATMTLGNLAALSQQNMKRLLAYSSIAHAGYALLGFVVFADAGVQAVLFYLTVYYIMNLGAFWVVMLIANATGREDLPSYRGLAWRGGALPALALSVFLFSLRAPAARRLRRQVLPLRGRRGAGADRARRPRRAEQRGVALLLRARGEDDVPRRAARRGRAGRLPGERPRGGRAALGSDAGPRYPVRLAAGTRRGGPPDLCGIGV